MKDSKKTQIQKWYDHSIHYLEELSPDPIIQKVLKEYKKSVKDKSLVCEGFLFEPIMLFVFKYLERLYIQKDESDELVLNTDYLDELYKENIEFDKDNIIKDLYSFAVHLVMGYDVTKNNNVIECVTFKR